MPAGVGRELLFGEYVLDLELDRDDLGGREGAEVDLPGVDLLLYCGKRGFELIPRKEGVAGQIERLARRGCGWWVEQPLAMAPGCA